MSDFEIFETADLDNGVKVNCTTETDRYVQDADCLESEFPYASKDNDLTSYWRLANDLLDLASGRTLTNEGASGSAINGPFGDGYYDLETDDYLHVTHADFDIPDELTVLLWVWADTLPASRKSIASKDIGAGGTSLCIRTNDASTVYNQISGETKEGYPTTAHALGTGAWKLVTVVFSVSENRLEVYYNGASVDSDTLANTSYIQKDGALEFGRDNRGMYYWDGRFAEIKWYNRALSDAEVLAIYNAGKRFIATSTYKYPEETMPADNKMLNTTITHSGLSANEKIIEIRWMLEGVEKAAYNNGGSGIVAGASTLIEEGDLDDGTFDDVNDDFTIEVDWESDQDNTLKITKMEGNYAYTGPVVSSVIGVDSASIASVGVVADADILNVDSVPLGAS